MFEGSTDAKVLVVSDFLRVQENAERSVLSGERKSLLQNALRRAGIPDSEVAYTVIHAEMPPGGKEVVRFSESQRIEAKNRCRELVKSSKANVLVPLGSYALEFLTGLESIDKQHCSILPVKAEFGARKTVPLFHPERVQREFGLSAYISFGATRVKSEMQTSEIQIPSRKFLLSLDLSFSDVTAYLKDVVAKSRELSCDIETGQGMINTVGFAVSPTEAIAIETHPEHAHFIKTPEQFHELWTLIAQIWANPKIAKIAQNALFETQWASRYGMKLANVTHDTMWCMKFLHPELDKGLDNVGRLYTRFPYWKDDHSDWNNIRNWRQHLEYNCKDTTGQFEAKNNQQAALESRKLSKLFYGYIMKFFPLIEEMCAKGIIVNETTLAAMKEKTLADIASHDEVIAREFLERLGRPVNVRSPKQLQTALKEMGIALPTKTTKDGDVKETADKKALAKLCRKYPKEPVLGELMEVSRLNKMYSSYLDFRREADGKIRYSLDGCPTETGRWAGYMDPWGNGFNPQTVPKNIRKIAVSAPDKVFVQIDLKQAESRYVAYEAPEPKLMQMLEEGRDVHKYVASRIFKKLEELVTKNERQLGKKSGHAANYGVGPRTFAEACLVEMGIYITETEARRIIDGYYETFPGIRKRQTNIQAAVRRERLLKTPIGRERHFYGRVNDQMFREAYAYAPQSVIPDITNHLMLHLDKLFANVDFLLQVHDSLLLQVYPKQVRDIWAVATDYKSWHPKIVLPGGNLVIPIDMEVGTCWGNLEAFDG